MIREWLTKLIRQAVRAEMQDKLMTIEEYSLAAASHSEEVKEVLTEASRIKAVRQAGKPEELTSRAPVRQRAFQGVATRRALAEKQSIQATSQTQMVHNNDVRAMEGK